MLKRIYGLLIWCQAADQKTSGMSGAILAQPDSLSSTFQRVVFRVVLACRIRENCDLRMPALGRDIAGRPCHLKAPLLASAPALPPEISRII
jgi:hypothetical protein